MFPPKNKPDPFAVPRAFAAIIAGFPRSWFIARGWLKRALEVAHSGHPWIGEL